MKSLMCSVFWRAWEWGPFGKPATRSILASYNQMLSMRDNRKARALIGSEWFQDRWPMSFDGVRDTQSEFYNRYTGFMQATSVSGSGTGLRGDHVIVDDPHNVLEAESEKVRKETVKWFTEVLPNRVNDIKTDSFVVIMQRVHQADVSGHILASEMGYEHVCIPMEYDPDRKFYTSIGWEDPRTKRDQLAWPERFAREDYEKLRKTMGAYAIASQYQQQPAPRGGGMFKADWFHIVENEAEAFEDENDRIVAWVRAWDIAATEDVSGTDPDFSSSCKMGMTKSGRFIIFQQTRDRLSPKGVESLMRALASADGKQVMIQIPQDPGAAGKAYVMYLKKALAGYGVKAERPTGTKEVRATPFATQAEIGNVYLIKGPWNQDFIDELTVFPAGAHDDQVDAASDAFNFLSKPLRTVTEMPMGGI